MKTKKEIGQQGEELACRFLVKHTFSILDRNYRTNFGEADIVAVDEDKNLHICEVKTVSHETTANVLRETQCFSPHFKFNYKKIRRMASVGEIYVERKKPNIKDIKLSSIFIFLSKKYPNVATLLFLENVNCWFQGQVFLIDVLNNEFNENY